MKKQIISFCLILLLMLSGCSIKLPKDTIYIPLQKVKAVELQREYVDEEGNYTYCKKVIANETDKETICNMLRDLPITKASTEEPNPIVSMPLIVILRGEKDHHLVLSEDMAFYDQIAYDYTEEGILDEFIDLYNNLAYEETAATVEPY